MLANEPFGDAVDIEALLAREGIRHTISLYSFAVDRGKFADVAATFTADGVLEVSAQQIFQGPEAIQRFMEQLSHRFAEYTEKSGATFTLQHHVTSSRLELTGVGEARAWTGFLATGSDGLDHCGSYIDRFRCVEDRWLIARRRIAIDWYAKTSIIRAIGADPAV
jgi:hypothetical protein